MHYILTMTIIYGGQNLLDDISCIDFVEVLFLSYPFEKFSSVAQFSHEEVAFWVLKELVQLQNIWMIHLFQDANLRQ